MRIVIPNQPAGTNLIIKARSKSGDSYSEWSRNFAITSATDTTAPKTPANPAGSMAGTSFVLKWDAVTQSADNSVASDLDRYEVKVTSSGSANSSVFVTKDTKFEFPFEQNVSVFGTPQSNVQMAVRAVDTGGNASAYSATISQTNPAPAAPTSFAGTAGANSLGFTWNAVADLDLKQYRIYSGTTSGSQTSLVWTGTALNATLTILDTTTDRWYKVVSVDVFNTESTASNIVGPIKPMSTVAVDTTAPGVPTNLAGTLTNAADGKTASMAVTWTGVSDNDLDSYIVAFRQTATPVNDWQYVTVDKSATSTTIQGLVPYAAYDIRIRAKDWSANYSNWTTIVNVTAQANTAPAVPTGLAMTAGKDNIQLSWIENTELDMKNNAGTYDVTVATDSAFTAGVLQYRTSNTTLAVNGLNSNTTYYARVRATDSAGLSSAYSASVNKTTSNFSGGSDGAVPTGAVTLSASAGLGYIYLSWTPLANNDPVIYDVYMSTTNNFTTYDATTKITEVSGTSAFIDTVVGGASLAYGTTYYFKVRARDKDGSSASVSNQASAAPLQAGTSDLQQSVNDTINTLVDNIPERTNLAVDPAATKNQPFITSGLVWQPSWYGSAGAGTTTLLTGITGPVPEITTAMRKTWTTGSVAGDTGFCHSNRHGATGFIVTPGQVITASSYLRVSGSTGKTGNIRFMYYDANNALVLSQGSTYVPLGSSWTRVSYTSTVPANATGLAIWSDVAGTAFVAGDTADGTGLLVEYGNTLNPYFDGNTPSTTSRVVYWTGAVNGSQPKSTATSVFNAQYGSDNIERVNLAYDPAATKSTLVANTLGWAANWFGGGAVAGAGTTTLQAGATDGPVPGVATYIRKKWTTAPSANGSTGFANTLTTNQGYPVTPGVTYTFSAYARTNATKKKVTSRYAWFDSAGNAVGAETTVHTPTAAPLMPAGGWMRVSLTLTPPAGAAYLKLWLIEITWDNGVGDTVWAVNDTLDATALLVEKSPFIGTYFDGNTADTSVRDYSWTGVANASTSKSTQVALATAQVNILSAQVSAEANDAVNTNPSFTSWPSGAAYPDGWQVWSSTPAPTKETTLARTAPYAVRFTCADTSDRGMSTPSSTQASSSLAPLPLGLNYVTVSLDVMAVSGTFSGAGILFDWSGISSGGGQYRFCVDLNAEIPNPIAGKWYRVTKVMQKPSGTSPQTGWTCYLMANYQYVGVNGSSVTKTAKDIIFNRVAFRPSTTEEISAYNALPSAQFAAKGTDLVTNGTGLMGSNYNFSAFDFNGADAPTGANGSFVAKSTATVYNSIDELIPFDPSKKYRLALQARQTVAGATGNMFGYIAPYAADGKAIQPYNYMYFANTTTTLAAPLNPGDTTITLTSAANWWGTTARPANTATANRSIIWWDYVDVFGKTWPAETYSQNWSGADYWSDGGVDSTTNIITLKAAYSGPARPAGTQLSNGSSGSTYLYMPSLNNKTVPEAWTAYSDVFSTGIQAQPAPNAGRVNCNWTTGLPPGTAKVKVGVIVNYAPSTGKHAIAAMSFSDAAAAQVTADNSSMTYIQSTAPSVGRSQDLWIDTTNGANTPKRWNGSAWVAATDKVATDAATAATNSSMTYIQSTAPTGRSQDLWIDTTGGMNTPKRWNGTAWVAVTDQAAINAAQTYTDTKFQATLKNSSVEYAVNSSETVAPTTGWSTATPTRTAGTFVWYRTVLTYGDNTTSTSNPALLTGNTGATGSQGIPGPAGADGTSLYTWIKYADTPTTGMSDSPTGKTYMGIAYNKTSSTESTVYTDYDWSLIKGADGSQGIQGPAGADGVTTYTWVKYADNVSGGGMSDDPTGKTYIGLAFNKTTATESTTATDYQWSLIQGPQGPTGPAGANAATISLTATSQVLTSPSTGGTTNPATSTVTGTALNTTITVWTYSVDGAAFSATVPAGVSRTGNVVTITGASMTARTIAVRMADANGIADTLTVAKVSDGATGATGPTGPTGGTGATGPAGADAYTVLLTNEAQTFAAGTTNALAGSATTNVLAYKGSTQQTATVGTITGGATGITAAVTNNGTTSPTITFTVTTALTTANGTFTIPVTVGGVTFNQIFSWSLAFTGAQGATGPTGPTGAAAAAIDLTATTQVLASPSGGGATTPATSTVTGTARNTTITVWEYAVDGGSFSATVPAGASRTGNVVTITGSTMTNRTITVRMADANGVADTITIAKTFDGATGPTGPTGGTGAAGADAYTVLLSNEAQTFAAGTTNALAGSATTTVIAYKGTAQQTATVGTITGGATGITAAVTNNGTTAPLITFTVTTALTTANGTFTIPVTVGGITFNQVFSWSLAFSGAAGATGPTGPAGAAAANIDVTATTQVLAAPAGGGATTPATSTVTGTATNTTITVWEYSVDGGAFSATVPAGASRTGNVVTITGSTMTARTITVRMADANGIADTLTVAKTFDGATGSTGPTGPTGGTGAAGADAYTVILSNEAQVFAGSTNAAVAGSATTSVIAYKGTAQQTATIGTITGQVTGLTTAITNNGTTSPTVTVSVTTALVTQSGTLTIPVTVGGVSFTKTFAWSVSYTGATGATGGTGPTGPTGVGISSITPYFYQVSPSTGAAPAQPTASPPPAPWTSTEPTYTANTALYRTERILYTNSTFAYTSVYRSSSYDAAAQAQTTADGKNKIMRSTSDATGSAGFVTGDLWWKIDANGNVVQQWKFVTGTGWVTETLMDGVLGSLNANKIVAGTTFTQNLFVKSTFTLGDATTPGIIQSYDYAAGTKGFKLASNGLEIVDGIIDAKAIKSGSSFTTNLFIGTGGAIQSTGYVAGSTGFKLSNTGLVIEGSGNTVSASVLKGGTITGTTINVGAGGVLNVDSTAAIKSNNYSAGSTGYSLGSTGLEINDGSIDAKVLKTNTAFITDLIVGRSADASGTVRSYDYSAGNAGWKIGKGLFEVNSGVIKAGALQIQSGASNLEEPHYSAFEFTPTFYSDKFSLVNATSTIQTTGGVQGNQFLRISTTTAGSASAIIGDSATDYHISVEAGKTYIISAWMKASTATAVSAYLRFKYSDASLATAPTPVTLAASGPWTRYAFVFTVPANITNAVVQVFNTTATAGVGIDIDGVMVEQQISALTTPSTYVMPGMTSADGGFLRTGQIQSNANVTVNGVTQPAWSINMAGGAQFGDARLRGSLIVGPSGTDTDAGQSFIASGNYAAGTTGWKISSSGDIEANTGTFRGRIIAGNETGTHAEMGSTGFTTWAPNPAYPDPSDPSVPPVIKVVSLGDPNSNDVIAVQNTNGNIVGGIDTTGKVSATGANLDATVFDASGNPQSGVQIYGRDFSDWMNSMPWGAVASAKYDQLWSPPDLYSVEIGMGELGFDYIAGRNYQIWVNGIRGNFTTTGPNQLIQRLRYTVDGTTPTVASPVLDSVMLTSNNTLVQTLPPLIWQGQINATLSGTMRILVTLGVYSGTGRWQSRYPAANDNAHHPMFIVVNDMGIDVPDVWQYSEGGNSYPANSSSTSATTVKKNYVTTWTSNGSATYRGINTPLRTDTSSVWQGYSSAGSYNGDQRGIWTFPDMTATLSGATVTKVEVYLYANHWYNNSGGTAFIKAHGYTSAPSTLPTLTTAVTSASWPNPGGRWVTLPSSMYAGFKSGTYRGVGVGPAGSTSTTYYGGFNGGSGAQIRVSYTK